MTHLTFEEISDLAERAADSGRVSAHVAECAECRDMLQRVQALIQAARALPREIDPPAEAWLAVRERVRGERGRRRNGLPRVLLIAASVVLVAGTLTVLSLVTRGQTAKAKAVQPSIASAGSSAVHVVDRSYDATIRELRATLAAQESQLSPATFRTVNRAMVVIDSAIAEARAALVADPSNQALMDILSAHYERKVDLLQRATELSSL